MKKQFKILAIMAVFVLGSVITTSATEFPGGGNPFEFHRGIPKTEVHEPISGVCTGLSQSVYDQAHNGGQNAICTPLNAH